MHIYFFTRYVDKAEKAVRERVIHVYPNGEFSQVEGCAKGYANAVANLEGRMSSEVNMYVFGRLAEDAEYRKCVVEMLYGKVTLTEVV